MVLAAASSSASASVAMDLCISTVKQVGTDCVEITSSEGPVFFVRLSYLQVVSPESIAEGAAFSDEGADDVVRAGEAFAVEKKMRGSSGPVRTVQGRSGA